MVPLQVEYLFLKSQRLVTSLKERTDIPLGPHKHKMAASNFVKILTAPKQKYFDQIFRSS